MSPTGVRRWLRGARAMRPPCWCPDTATPGRPRTLPTNRREPARPREDTNGSTVSTFRRASVSTIDLSADLHAALYLRKGACNDEDAEVRCNDDDEPGQKERSRIDVALDPGMIFVFVDGSGEASGTYRIQASTRDAPLADVCRVARPLRPRRARRATSPTRSTTSTLLAAATQKEWTPRFDSTRRPVRGCGSSKSSSFVRSFMFVELCEDSNSEVACSDSGFADDEAAWVGVLDAGAYWVFADGADDASPGAFTLAAEMVPQGGFGVGQSAPGDGCGDAVPLNGTTGRIEGDTFAAKDDVAITCAPNGGADVVYRFDLSHKSRVTARLVGDESSHALALERACAEKATELSCGSIVDRTVEAGTYFLVVDGARPESLGRFALTYKIRDMAQVEATCAKVPALSFNRAEHSTTVAAGDEILVSLRRTQCGAGLAGSRLPHRSGQAHQCPGDPRASGVSGCPVAPPGVQRRRNRGQVCRSERRLGAGTDQRGSRPRHLLRGGGRRRQPRPRARLPCGWRGRVDTPPVAC